MSKVIYRRSGRVARITLNRPEVFNAIDDEMPGALSAAVAAANADPGVHVIVMSSAGKAFSAGYDLSFYAEGDGAGEVTQSVPWNPLKDY
ncbi:MAG: enoyl-CoA hydratase-related protein, partial [Pseudomonadota bacterium]|nr:enoyl-CoA hydratase-related protein [Pseudomonadota bacterium]